MIRELLTFYFIRLVVSLSLNVVWVPLLLSTTAHTQTSKFLHFSTSQELWTDGTGSSSRRSVFTLGSREESIEFVVVVFDEDNFF